MNINVLPFSVLRKSCMDSYLCSEEQVEERQGIPWIIQRVDYGGKSLDNDLTFSFYQIKNESTLFLTMPINKHIIIQIDEHDYINECWTRPSDANTYTFDQLKHEICDTLKIKTSPQDFYKTFCLLPKCNNKSLVIDNYMRIWTNEAAEIWDKNQITLIFHLKQTQTLKWYNQTKYKTNQLSKQRFSIQIIINNKHIFRDLGKILLTMSSNVTISTFIQSAKKKIDKKYCKKYDLSYEEQNGLQIYIRSKKDNDIKQMQSKWYEIIDMDEPIKDYVINNNDEVIVFIFNIDSISIPQKEPKKQEPVSDTMIGRIKALKGMNMNEDRDKEIKDLLTILSNILKNPFNPKYQSINIRKLKQKFIKLYPICIQLLYDSGFKKASNGKKVIFNINNMKLLKKTHNALEKMLILETDENDQNDNEILIHSEEKKEELTADEKAKLEILKELMKEFKIDITVKSNVSNNTYEICDIGLLNTVKRLKVSIAKVSNILKTSQRLSWQGQIMNDQKLLKDYIGFRENPIVTLTIIKSLNITLIIKTSNDDNLFEFDDVDKNETILDIKNKISARTNCPFYIQTLVRNGIQLDDGKGISEYGIKNEDILYLSVGLITLDTDNGSNNNMLFDGYLGNGNDNDNMILYLKTIEGNIVIIDDICVGDSVDILKQKLCEKKRIPVEKQTLIRRGFIMEDGKRLSQYGVEDKDNEICVGVEDNDGNVTF